MNYFFHGWMLLKYQYLFYKQRLSKVSFDLVMIFNRPKAMEFVWVPTKAQIFCLQTTGFATWFQCNTIYWPEFMGLRYPQGSAKIVKPNQTINISHFSQDILAPKLRSIYSLLRLNLIAIPVLFHFQKYWGHHPYFF